MKVKFQYTILWVVSILSLPSLLAQSVPQLINYQGQILNPDGTWPPTGDYVLSFRVFDAAEGGNLIWGPQVFDGQSGVGLGSKIPLVQGYFNVLLGPADTNAVPLADAFTGSSRFLEITVSNRPPISPRQQFASAPFALQAKRAEHALLADSSSNATSLGGRNAGEIIIGMVPIGAVVSFYGDIFSLPPNWKMCNGDLIDDSESPLLGQFLPDLRETFVRGASEIVPAGITGGQDSVESHSHYFSDTASVSIGTRSLSGWTGRTKASRATAFHDNIYALVVDNSRPTSEQDTHGHTGSAFVSGFSNSGGGHDNRPRFFSLHYIMRIR